MKKFLLIAAVIGLLASCGHPVGKNPGEPNENGKTAVVFDNKQGICDVSVYKDSQRREEDLITVVSAGVSSEEIE